MLVMQCVGCMICHDEVAIVAPWMSCFLVPSTHLVRPQPAHRLHGVVALKKWSIVVELLFVCTNEVGSYSNPPAWKPSAVPGTGDNWASQKSTSTYQNSTRGQDPANRRAR